MIEFVKNLTFAELELALHDAALSLENIELKDGVCTLGAYLERPTRFRAARFPMSLEIALTTSFEFDDPERIGQLVVGEIVSDGSVIIFTGPIPGELRIYSHAQRGRLAVAKEPVQVRRWGRWLPA